jgi:uncharacterized protein (UPF0147 family)
MKITNKDQLLEFIRKESLKILNQEAFSSNEQELDVLTDSKIETIKDKLKDLEDGFIDVNEKRLSKLEKDEDSAREKEEYVELQKVKKEKAVVLDKLILSYQKKIEYLSQTRDILNNELKELGIKGSSVFQNKEMSEFVNDENVPNNTVIKINTVSSELVLKKVSNNSFLVVSTTAPGVKSGDIVKLSPYLKVGYQANIDIFRDNKPLTKSIINNVTKITKNPS